MRKNSAGSDTYRMKKFIQARPASGSFRQLAAGKADEDQAEEGQREIEDVEHGAGLALEMPAVE